MPTVSRWLSGLSLALALLALTPMPQWESWELRFVAGETRLLPVLLGLVGAGLAWRARATRQTIDSAPRATVWMGVGLAGALLAGFPLASQLAFASSLDVPISWSAYLGARAEPELEPRRDIALDPSRPELLVDIYPGGAPWVLVVHGGSWRHGDKGEVPGVSRAMAAAGYTVFDLRYRLAPEHRFPAAIEDALCAVAAIRGQAAELGVDPERGALLGRSAGGQVALLTANAPASLAPAGCGVPSPPVAAVISIYGPADLAWGYHHPYFPDVVGSPFSLRTYLGAPPEEIPEIFALASPNKQVTVRSPPALLVHGLSDRLVRPLHVGFMADAMAEQGRRAERLEIPWAEHGFDVRPGGVAEQIARAEILRFLADKLGS